MKVSFALGQRGPLTREKAWICLTANLGFPGSGSVMAGKWYGYLQMLLTLAGLILSMVFGSKFMLWFLANWTRLQDPSADAMTTMREMWLQVRWALAGIAFFAIGWLWGAVSGLAIVARAKRVSGTQQPPKVIGQTDPTAN